MQTYKPLLFGVERTAVGRHRGSKSALCENEWEDAECKDGAGHGLP